MIIFPAVDILGGRAVRLRRGRREDATVYADDPCELAAAWAAKGARWLHVVDLDGAFDGAIVNLALISRIAAEVGLPIQAGGGIRDVEGCRRYLDAGAERLIIGTAALEKPEVFAAMLQEFPGRVGVSLDAEDGRLKSRGWLKDAGLTIEEALPRLKGASFLIYTDISRDGMNCGVNLHSLRRLLRLADMPVIAAGGVAALDDIKALAKLAAEAAPEGKLEGAISGRAICEGTLDLAEALRAAQG